MKNAIFTLICLLGISNGLFSQTSTRFSDETDVFNYLSGKKFYSTDGSISVEIGYSGSINSYGIKLNGSTTHFNLSVVVISPTLARVTGESLQNPDGRLKILVNPSTNCLSNEGSYYCLNK
jgi:hypothetical protein